MARAATKDTELHGKTIKENDRVLLWYLASNRDESVFPNPHKFDITREGLADQHQAFGGRGTPFLPWRQPRSPRAEAVDPADD